MKIYKKIVYDKDDNIIEEISYEHHGQVAQAGGSVKNMMFGGSVTKSRKK